MLIIVTLGIIFARCKFDALLVDKEFLLYKDILLLDHLSIVVA